MTEQEPKAQRQYTRPLNRWYDEVGRFHVVNPDTGEPVCNLQNYYTLSGAYPYAPHDSNVCGNCKRIAKARGL